MALNKYQTILRIELNNGICYSRHHLMVPGNFYPRVADSFKRYRNYIIIIINTFPCIKNVAKTMRFTKDNVHTVVFIFQTRKRWGRSGKRISSLLSAPELGRSQAGKVCSISKCSVKSLFSIKFLESAH